MKHNLSWHRHLLVLAFGSFMFMACQSEAPESGYDLQLNPTLQQVFEHTINHKVRSEMEYEGQVYETSMQQDASFQLKITELLEDGFIGQCEFKRLQIKAYNQNQTVLIKSDKKDTTDVRSNLLQLLIDKPFYITFRHNGTIKNIRGWETWMENMALRVVQRDATKAAYLVNELKKTWSHDQLAAQFEICWRLAPDSAVSKGATWSKPVLFSSGYGNQESAMAYTLDHVDNFTATISGVAQTGTQSQQPFYDPASGLTYDVKGENLLKAEFDLQSQWVTKTEVRQKLKGRAMLPISEDRPEGLQMPVKIESTLTIVRDGSINK
jgi:hypothetical protein